METVEDYLRRADECDRLAKTSTTAEHRRRIEQIAATWRNLAKERLEFVKQRSAPRNS